MYPISVSAENLLRKRDRLWRIKVEIDGVEYAEDKVISFEIEQSIVSGQEFEIGAAASSRLVIRLRTNAEIPPNAKIVPYVALSSEGITWQDADFAWEEADIPWEGGTTAWIPLGEFYVDSREKVNNTWEYTCYDKLMFANTVYVSSLSYPATMQAVWDEICDQLGYTYDSSVVIDPSYMVPAAPTGYTCRQVMGFIAAANAACVYAGRDGIIKFKRFSASEPHVYEMTTSDYIRARLTNPVKSYSRVVVVYDPDDDLAYEAGEGDEDHTLYVDCPFATQQIANNLLALLNGFAYVPVEMHARGYPQLEHGDVIQFERDESMAWMDADIAWEDADFPWDGIRRYQTIILHQKMTFRGGLAMSLEAPSKSEQESEFGIDGSLTAAVNRLNRNAVKKDKIYYGLSISDSYGLKVQRSDGKSDLTLNSDVMDWKVDGVSQLYYDALDNRLKFGGTLEGVDGIFSGTIEAGTFIGGTIIGTSISGGTIIGTNIASSITYPRAELSVSQHLVAARQDADNYLAMQSQGFGNTPALTFYANGSLVGFLNRSVNGLTIGTFGSDSLMFQSAGHLIMTLSGSLLIDGNIGLTGTFYVATTPGGPANTQVTFYKGIRIG